MSHSFAQDTDEYGKELGDLVVERNHSPCPTPPPESESHYEAAKFQRPQKNNAAKTNTKKQPPKPGKKTTKHRTRRKKSTEYEEPVYADIGVSDCSSSGSEHDDDDTQSQNYQHPKFKQQQAEPDRPETRRHENPYNPNITRFVFMMEAPADK